MIEVVSNSPDETTTLGKQIASHLTKGSVVTFTGTLGSGKTYLAKGIAAGLGITDNLTSPTYTIINEYPRSGHPTLYHIDAYRLNNDKEFEDIGGVDIVHSDGICLIEWSERIPKSLPLHVISIGLEISGDFSRLIKIDGIEKL